MSQKKKNQGKLTYYEAVCHVGTVGHKVEILTNVLGFHLCNSNHVVRELILLVCLTCGKLPKACMIIDCGTKMLRCLKTIGR